jgi:hypothetical protein
MNSTHFHILKIYNDGVSILKLPCKISVKGTMFQQCKIHEYTWTSLDGKMHNQTDHAITDRRHQGHLMSDLLEQMTVLMITTRCLLKSGRDW